MLLHQEQREREKMRIREKKSQSQNEGGECEELYNQSDFPLLIQFFHRRTTSNTSHILDDVFAQSLDSKINNSKHVQSFGTTS